MYRFQSNCFTDAPTKFHSDRLFIIYLWQLFSIVCFRSFIPNSLVECPRLNAIIVLVCSKRSLHAKSHYILFHFTHSADTRNNLKFAYCFPQRFVQSEKAVTATTIRPEFSVGWEFLFRFFQENSVRFPHMLQSLLLYHMLGTMLIYIHTGTIIIELWFDWNERQVPMPAKYY